MNDRLEEIESSLVGEVDMIKFSTKSQLTELNSIGEEKDDWE